MSVRVYCVCMHYVWCVYTEVLWNDFDVQNVCVVYVVRVRVRMCVYVHACVYVYDVSRLTFLRIIFLHDFDLS